MGTDAAPGDVGQALVRFLVSKKVVAADEIREIVEGLDREDAKTDGVYGGPVVP